MQLAFLLSVLAYARLATSFDWSVFGTKTPERSGTIERDVCIIGGGASGVHAAVSLSDLNKTVVLVERNNYLGGHAYTYIDPATQIPIDIGVVIHVSLPTVYDFFGKFNVPLLNISSVASDVPGAPANKSLPAIVYAYNTLSEYSDFRNGSPVDAVNPFEVPGFSKALGKYVGVLSNYAYLLHGYDLPDPVPEDLYLPYGAFLEKYNLTAVFPLNYRYGQGMGDEINLPTIYIIKYFTQLDINIGLNGGYLTQAQGNTSELYTRAGEYLGAQNILLGSTVTSAKRQNTTSGRSELLVSTRGGGRKALCCKQILNTIPPSLKNLAGWDLTPEEHAVFSQLDSGRGYWTGLVKNVGLNQSIEYLNAAAQTPFNIPELPALYAIDPVGVVDDVWAVKFGSNDPTLTDRQVQSLIERQIQTEQRAHNVPVTKPEWLIFQSHTPFSLETSPEAIKDGFFKNLTNLQGGLGGTMFYSGAAFHAHVTSLLWRFNEEVVIPKMMSG